MGRKQRQPNGYTGFEQTLGSSTYLEEKPKESGKNIPKLSVVNIHHSLPTNFSNVLTFDCFSSQKSGSENLAELFLMFLCLLDFVLLLCSDLSHYCGECRVISTHYI